jgi:O-antigen/teichoic acid export membrane protein
MQHDKEKFAATLSKSISLAVFATTSLVGFLFFTADFIIVLLLGPKWALSVVLFKILIFNTVTLSINSILNKAILSKGYSKLKFKVLIVTRILYLCSMPFGYYYGVEAFATAFVAIRFITISINWIYFKDKLEVNLIDILKTIMFPLGIMFFWVGVYYSGLLMMPNYVYLILFLLTYFSILYSVKNSGLLFTLSEIQKIQKKIQKTKK